MRTVAILLAMGFAIPAVAEENSPPLPKNTINCAQFKKTGPNRWIEVGTAVFDLGEIKDIHLNDQPVAPGSFKFGGIDVFPVLEKKCGTPETPAPEQAAKTADPATISMAQATPRTDLDEAKAATAQPSPSAEVNEHAPAAKDKAATLQQDGRCASGRSVYGADALKGDKTFIEVFFDTRMRGDRNPDFLIRQINNNEIEWSYKGVMRSGRFIFTYAVPRQAPQFGSVMLSSMSPQRRKSVSLEPVYIKPTRDGTGEAILQIQGIGELLASRRFKFEGKRPSGELPDIFYFDRCE
jgi:hypothetical protein